MRHRKKRNKLSRDASHRESLLSNLSKQLIEHERIKTSQAKAKAVKPEVEQLITLAKRGDLHARRQALANLHNDKFAVHTLFAAIAPRYADDGEVARRPHVVVHGQLPVGLAVGAGAAEEDVSAVLLAVHADDPVDAAA